MMSAKPAATAAPPQQSPAQPKKGKPNRLSLV